MLRDYVFHIKPDRFTRFYARGFYESSCISHFSCCRPVIISYRSVSVRCYRSETTTLYSLDSLRARRQVYGSLAVDTISRCRRVLTQEMKQRETERGATAATGNGNRSIARIHRIAPNSVIRCSGNTKTPGRQQALRGTAMHFSATRHCFPYARKKKRGEGKARERELRPSFMRALSPYASPSPLPRARNGTPLGSSKSCCCCYNARGD